MSFSNNVRGWVFLASLAACGPSAVAGADAALGNARVAIHGDRISVSTGSVERVWHWTGSGLVTVSLRDLKSARDRVVKPQRDCDWDLPGAITKGAKATLVSTESRISDDDGFSGRHLELVSTIRYEEARLLIQHTVWAFPDAPGLRTQLRVKALPGFDPAGKPAWESTFKDCGATFLKPSARAEYLPLDFAIRNERLYWGYYNNPGNRHDQSQDMLREQVVKGWPIFLREDRREIPALAAIGVDVLQIDDGWQKKGGGARASNFQPKYQHGWKDIKSACDQAGLRLGLWVAIRNAKLEELYQNLDELGFISWKADFEHLASRADYENRITSLRAVMKHAWMNTQFTLCPEYDDPRYGWYFAQEYGSIYFQNIQEAKPDHLTMVPFQVLRQHWLMAKYFPANKLQVLLQNPKRVGPFSDGREHGHGYCFAMGLPFVPCFFQSAQFLDPDGQKELKDLIALYKTCREDVFTSITYPIGDLPDNESWSGFQMTSTRTPDSGHLLLFRELHNAANSRVIQLKFLAGKTIAIEDRRTGKTRSVKVGADGGVPFEIPNHPDYAFLRYEVR